MAYGYLSTLGDLCPWQMTGLCNGAQAEAVVEGDGRLLFGEVPSVLDRDIGRDDLSEGVGALTTDWRR